MSKKGIEEKSPLLFMVDSNDDILKAKQKMYIENGRFYGIANGATAVFTHFPNYIGTCWITTALCGLIFFMMILLLFSTISTNNLRVPRCVPPEDALNNKTIHLVHARHHPNEITFPELDILDKVIRNYPGYNVRLILIEPLHWVDHRRKRQAHDEKHGAVATTTTMVNKNVSENASTRGEVKAKRSIDDTRHSLNFDARRFLDLLLRGSLINTNVPNRLRSRTSTTPTTTIKTSIHLNDLLDIYPNMVIENTTYNQVFFKSPLYAYWPYLNDELKVFAVRVLQLWQYGGLSFDLDPPKETNLVQNASAETDKDFEIFHRHLLKFIISDRLDTFQNVRVDIVAADESALHLESRIPCHAFFGEVLMNLRKAQQFSSVKDVLRASMKVFCKHYAVNRLYCDSVLKDY